MSAIIERNLKALETVDPEAAATIRAAGRRNDELIVEPARGPGEWTGVYKGGDNSRSYLISRYHPTKEAAQRIGHFDYEKTFLFIVFGFALGYELKQIIARKDNRAVVIVVDPRPDFMLSVLQTIPCEEILGAKNVYWAVGTETAIQAAFQKHALTLAQFLNSLALFENPILKRHLDALYTRLRGSFFDAASYSCFMVGNDPNDTLIGIENAFANLRTMLAADDIARYFGTLSDRPAIMCMAGPSLDQQIPALKSLDRNQVLILSADTTLGKLLREGIVPHLVFTLERGDIVYDLFYKNVDIPPQVSLVAQPVVDVKIPERFPARTFFSFRSAIYFERWIAKALGLMSVLDCGFSVAHMTFSTARVLGCNPIILAGQDLSYNESGLSYTSGTYRETCTAEDDVRDGISPGMEEGKLEIPAIGGGSVQTRHDWWLFKQWLEVEVARTNVPVIDVKEQGALIKGTVNMTLPEALAKHCRGPRPEPFMTVCRRNDDLFFKRAVKRLKNLERAIETEIATVKRIRSLFDKADLGIKSLSKSLDKAAKTGQMSVIWKTSSNNITTMLHSVFHTIEPVGVQPCLARFVLQPMLFKYALKRTQNMNIQSLHQAISWKNEQGHLLSMLIKLNDLVEMRLTMFKNQVISMRSKYAAKKIPKNREEER